MDSCGSVSLAHSKYLSNIKDCSQYNIPIVTLNGIGGSTLPITKAGVLTHVTPQRKLIKFLCYVFDTPIGKTQEMILLGLKTLVESNIDIRHHMKLSVQGLTKMVRFLDIESRDNTHRRHVDLFHHDVDDINSLCNESAVDYYRGATIFEECVNEVFMTEIQLKILLNACKGRKRTPRRMVMKPWSRMV